MKSFFLNVTEACNYIYNLQLYERNCKHKYVKTTCIIRLYLYIVIRNGKTFRFHGYDL